MAEKAVLSSMMQEPARFIPLAIAEGLTDESFSTPGLRLYFRHVIEDFHRWETIDLTAFIQRRHAEGIGERMGGPSMAAEIFSYAITSDGWTQWIALVKEAHARRIAQESARKIAEAETSEDAIAEISASLEAIRNAVEGPRRSMDAIEATREFLAALQSDYEAGSLPGNPTGILELDEITGGMRAGELWTVAAKSTRGKSVLMFQIAAEFLSNDKRVAVFSVELMAKEVIGRLAAVIGRIHFNAITQPRTASKRDMEGIQNAAQKLAASALHIDASAGQTLESIRAESRRIRDARGALALVVVDYIQICGVDRVKNEMREREIARISGGLKQLAKELRCPVLTASQLNDQGQTRESRAIEQDSDVLLFISEDGIKVGKNRNGRRNDVLPLYLDGAMQKFSFTKPSP